MRSAIVAMVLMGLAGCATPTDAGRETDYQKLARECRERDGILVPLASPPTGRAETDNACELQSSGSGRLRSGS